MTLATPPAHLHAAAATALLPAGWRLQQSGTAPASLQEEAAGQPSLQEPGHEATLANGGH